MRITIFTISLLFSVIQVSAQWKTYVTSNSAIHTNSMFDLTIDTNGTFWLGTQEGLGWFDGTNFGHYDMNNSPIPALSYDNIYTVAIDDQNNVWLGTEDGYLLVFDQDTTWIDYSDSIDIGDVYAIEQDRDGHIWVGHSRGLMEFDQNVWIDHADSLHERYVTELECDVDNNMWIGTKDGFEFYDNANTWKYWNEQNSAMSGGSDWVESIHMGVFDNIWIGTRSGIYDFDKDTTFVKYTSSNSGLWQDEVVDISVAEDSTLWVANEGGSMAYFKNGTWDYHPLPFGFSFSNAIVIDEDGYKWITAQDGFARFNTQGVGPYDFTPSSPPVILQENTTSDDLRVFPNPADNKVHVSAEKRIDRVFVTDLSGKVMITQPGGQAEQVLDLSGLQSGVYLLLVQTDSRTHTRKLLVR